MDIEYYDLFKDWVVKHRGFKPKSATTYIAKTRYFLKHLGKELDPLSVTHQDIIDFLEERRVEGYEQNDRLLFKNSLEMFFRFIASEYGISNPALDLPVIKKVIKDPLFLTPFEIEKILLAMDENKNQDRARRNCAMVALLAATGIRVEELEAAKMGDVTVQYRQSGEPTHLEINVSAMKGSFARTIPFARLTDKDITTEYFMRYYTWLRFEKNHHANLPLFYKVRHSATSDDSGKPVMRDTFRGALERARKRAGIDKAVSFHQFRHFYGTYATLNGMNLLTLSRFMGHGRITTTMRYIHIAERIGANALSQAATKGMQAPPQARGYADLFRKFRK